MATWEDVHRIASALPDAEETTSYGQPCFKVNGRPFVNTGRVEGSVVTRAPDDERGAVVVDSGAALCGRGSRAGC